MLIHVSVTIAAIVVISVPVQVALVFPVSTFTTLSVSAPVVAHAATFATVVAIHSPVTISVVVL